MTDQPAPFPADQSHQDAPPLNNYEIKCLNGLSVRVASPNDLQNFCKIAKADGYVASDKVFINYDAIATIEYVGPFVPNQVAQFGPRSVT